jgi:hypothetical protein
MKVGVSVLIGLMCIISVSTTPQSDSLRQAIDQIFVNFSPASGKFSKHPFAKALLNSINRDCVAETLTQHKLQEKLLDSINADPSKETEKKSYDSVVYFADIALSCSDKLDAVLGLAFDLNVNFMSFFNVFKEEDEFDGINDVLSCVAQYSVEKKFFNPEVYTNVNYQVSATLQEQCEMEIAAMKNSFKKVAQIPSTELNLKEKDCVEEEFYGIWERVVVKYSLLLLAGSLTDEQKINEKKSFIGDVHQSLDKILLCYSNQDHISDNSV